MADDSRNTRSLGQAIALGAGIGTGIGIALHSIPIGACVGVGIMLAFRVIKGRMDASDGASKHD